MNSKILSLSKVTMQTGVKYGIRAQKDIKAQNIRMITGCKKKVM